MARKSKPKSREQEAVEFLKRGPSKAEIKAEEKQRAEYLASWERQQEEIAEQANATLREQNELAHLKDLPFADRLAWANMKKVYVASVRLKHTLAADNEIADGLGDLHRMFIESVRAKYRAGITPS